MAKLTADQWGEVRAGREAGRTFPDLAKQFGISYQAIQRRAKRDRWGDGRDVSGIIRRKVAEKVAGLVAGCNHKEKAEAIENAAVKGLEIVKRHQDDWKDHHNNFTVKKMADDFELGKRAKICAEVLAIRQKAERAAYGLEEVQEIAMPEEINIKLVSANAQAG